jgi:autotransporter-associated beta strand protein
LPAGASPTAALTGAGTITKTGVGRFELQTAQTTFTGKYVVKNGSLGITTDGTLGAVPTTTQSDYFTLDGGGIYGDNPNGITLNAKRGITLGASGGFLAFYGTGLNPYDGIISGTAGGGLRIAVDDALTANSAGTVTLNGANTYNGPTEIDTNATLVLGIIADGGTSSGLGKSSNAASNLILSGGTLRYTGAAVSTDRNLTLATAGGFIDASGANNAPLKFTSTSTIGVAGTGPRILVLRGSSTGDNTMSLAIVDQGANPTTLNKTDAGTWVLTNTANSYTGNTTISAGGRLKLGSSGVIPDASLVQLFSSATLDLNGFDETVRSISGTSGTIALGANSLTIKEANDTFSGTITANGGRIVLNDGVLQLTPSGAAFNGGITLNPGSTLLIGNSTALGAKPLAANGGNIGVLGAAPVSVTNSVWLNTNQGFSDFLNPAPGPLTWNTSGANKWTIIGSDRLIGISTAAGGYTVTINQPIAEDAPGRSLTKTGNGTLVLNGVNTYTGNTTVQDGTLSLGQPSLADWSTVVLSHLAKLNLNFTPSTADTVSAFYIDGIRQASGIWGAVGSGAAHESVLITGSGLLQVGIPIFSLPGDFNADGRIDMADYVAWRKNPAAHGGSTGYDAWRQGFGSASGAGAGNNLAQTGVPEPTTMPLLSIAFLVLNNFRKRKRAAGFIPAV